MKIGDLVKPKTEYHHYVPSRPDHVCAGIIIGFDEGEPIVFWNDVYHSEVEYTHQLEVLNV